MVGCGLERRASVRVIPLLLVGYECSELSARVWSRACCAECRALVLCVPFVGAPWAGSFFLCGGKAPDKPRGSSRTPLELKESFFPPPSAPSLAAISLPTVILLITQFRLPIPPTHNHHHCTVAVANWYRPMHKYFGAPSPSYDLLIQ